MRVAVSLGLRVTPLSLPASVFVSVPASFLLLGHLTRQSLSITETYYYFVLTDLMYCSYARVLHSLFLISKANKWDNFKN